MSALGLVHKLAELDDVVVDRADEESDALIDPAGCSLVGRFDNLWPDAENWSTVGESRSSVGTDASVAGWWYIAETSGSLAVILGPTADWTADRRGRRERMSRARVREAWLSASGSLRVGVRARGKARSRRRRIHMG